MGSLSQSKPVRCRKNVPGYYILEHMPATTRKIDTNNYSYLRTLYVTFIYFFTWKMAGSRPYGEKINSKWNKREEAENRHHHFDSDLSDPEDSEVEKDDPMGEIFMDDPVQKQRRYLKEDKKR